MTLNNTFQEGCAINSGFIMWVCLKIRIRTPNSWVCCGWFLFRKGYPKKTARTKGSTPGRILWRRAGHRRSCTQASTVSRGFPRFRRVFSRGKSGCPRHPRDLKREFLRLGFPVSGWFKGKPDRENREFGGGGIPTHLI